MGYFIIMLTINLDYHGKACVWMDDSPSIIYPVIDIISQDLKTNLPQKSNPKKVVLEVLIPVGARICYGLLGVEFIPNSSGKLSLEVCLSTENEAIFVKSIAAKLDVVRVGLPKEYGNGVIEGVKLGLNERFLEVLGSGVLRFDQAAHGEIGSSNQFFRQISATIIQLLSLDIKNPQVIGFFSGSIPFL